MSNIILVTGGARSGKSSFAEELCEQFYQQASEKETLKKEISEFHMNKDKIAYIATAQIFDDEMKERVRIHRQRRPKYWHTFEAPINVADVLESIVAINGGDEVSIQKNTDIIINIKRSNIYFTSALIDCLTVLTTNVFLSENIDWDKPSNQDVSVIKEKVFQEIDLLLESAEKIDIPVVMVTNELGMGIVPKNKMARIFRDIAGWVNQHVAARANKVYLVVSGIPMCIKNEND